MSWRDQKILAVACLLPASACGFHPLYAERSPMGFDPVLASIDVRPAPDRLGQIMTETVREQLNPEGAAVAKRYVLTLGASETRSNLGIRRDNTSSRGELLISASLELAPTGGGKALYAATIRSQTAFNLSDDAYAATVAEDNARREAAAELGREVALQVELFFQREAKGPTP